MHEPPVFDRLKEIMQTIEFCLHSKLQLPSLILLYATIDSVGWLASTKPNEQVRRRFTRWVDDWLLKAKPLGSTSLELYAARCGVLHSLTSDSHLSKAKTARRVVYSLGDQTSAKLQALADRIKPNEYVAVRIEDLYGGFKQGLVAFLEDVMKDQVRKRNFEERAARHFMYLSQTEMNEAVKALNIP